MFVGEETQAIALVLVGTGKEHFRAALLAEAEPSKIACNELPNQLHRQRAAYAWTRRPIRVADRERRGLKAGVWAKVGLPFRRLPFHGVYGADRCAWT